LKLSFCIELNTKKPWLSVMRWFAAARCYCKKD